MVFQCYYIISVNMQVGEIKVPCTKNFFNYQLYVEKVYFRNCRKRIKPFFYF